MSSNTSDFLSKLESIKDNPQELFKAFRKWSYSRMSTLQNCPLSFYNKYVVKKTTDSKTHDKTHYGKVAHSVLEEHLVNHFSEKEYNSKEIIEKYKERYEIDSSLDVIKDNAQSLIKRLTDFEKNVEPIISIGIEQTLTTEDYYGVVDLVIETPSKVIILDHKTTNSNPTLYWYKKQLYMYGALYLMINKLNKPVLHGINFAYHDKILWDTEAKSKLFLETELKVLENKTKSLLGKYFKEYGPNKEWPGELNNLCPYCDYREGCELYINNR